MGILKLHNLNKAFIISRYNTFLGRDEYLKENGRWTKSDEKVKVFLSVGDALEVFNRRYSANHNLYIEEVYYSHGEEHTSLVHSK